MVCPTEGARNLFKLFRYNLCGSSSCLGLNKSHLLSCPRPYLGRSCDWEHINGHEAQQHGHDIVSEVSL